MKLKKTFISFIAIWLIFNLLIEWKIPRLNDRNQIYLFVDLLLSIPMLIFAYNFFNKIYKNINRKLILTTISTLCFYPTLWFLMYPFVPYGNHLLAATPDGDNARPSRYYFYSKNASAFILNVRGASCSFPYLNHLGLRIVQYSTGKNETITILMQELSNYRENKLTEEQKQFLLAQFYKTISQCDVNIEIDRVSPLYSAIAFGGPEIASALIQRGADVNKMMLYKNGKGGSTLLYRAEDALKSEKDETQKQSLIKIIELLKKAGAKSEKIDLPEKQILN